MKRLALALACLALVAAGCGGGSEKQASAPKDTATPAPTKPEVTVPKTLPKTLVKQDLKVGDGATATAGKSVTVQYVGVSAVNGRQFDASWDRGEPFTFTLGEGGVIQGWDQGVEGMKVGGRRQLVIPPDLAYGPQGQPPTIGPNETLVFVIDLLSVK
jgi:peptidylprolyl isomerase